MTGFRWAPALVAGLCACAPVTPLSTDPAGASVPSKSVMFVDFVAHNLPRNLTGQVLPLEMLLFEIDPATGERTAAPSWSVGVCRADAFGCESGEIKTLRLELPPGTYAVGYLGSTAFAAPWYSLMAFGDSAARGGDVVIGGLTVTPEFGRSGRVTPHTPVITVGANEIAYAGLLQATYGSRDLTTAFGPAPDRRAALLARSGLTPASLVDRPGRYL